MSIPRNGHSTTFKQMRSTRLCCVGETRALRRLGFRRFFVQNPRWAMTSPAQVAQVGGGARPLTTCGKGIGWRCLKATAGPAELLLKVHPIEAWAGVLFAAGGDVFMPGDVANRVAQRQPMAQLRELPVLRRLKDAALQTFQFNAHRKVVAVGPATPLGRAGVPGSGIGSNKLHQLAVAANQKVRRDLHATDLFKIRVGSPLEPVGEQLFDFGATKNTRRQAD